MRSIYWNKLRTDQQNTCDNLHVSFIFKSCHTDSMIKRKLLKNKSYPLIKAMVERNTNTIYKARNVAPLYKVWRNDTGWFARVYDTVAK